MHDQILKATPNFTNVVAENCALALKNFSATVSSMMTPDFTIAALVKHVIIYSESHIEITWKYGDGIAFSCLGKRKKVEKIFNLILTQSQQ